MAFSLGVNIWLALVGGALAIVATILAYSLCWSDLLRLRLFWISIGLSLYLLLRGIIGAGLEISGREPLWWGLLAFTGLASLPLSWWLTQSRLHWLADTNDAAGRYLQLYAARPLGSAEACTSSASLLFRIMPSQTGFMASVSLIVSGLCQTSHT